MSRDDLENLLRNHLACELDSQRGQAAKAFAEQVMEPMRIGLEKRQRHWHRARVSASVAMAMAACIAIGFFAPRLLSPTAPVESIAKVPTIQNPVAVQTVSMEHTRVQSNMDAGSVMLDADTPGRKIIQQRLEHWQWNDPNTGGRFDVVEPSESNLILEVHRQ